MSITRANVKSGPAKVTWNSITMFSSGPIIARHQPSWANVETSVHGVVDKVVTDLVITIPIRLWGAYENVTTLFPAAVLTPTIGQRLFGTTDLPLVIHGINQDRITYPNAQLTKLANLYLGVDNPIFAADVEFTCLIKNATNPEDAGAYYVEDTAAYADTTFAKTNFKQQRYAAAWGAKTGFSAFTAEKGWNIEWSLGLAPQYSANVGTYDMVVTDFSGRATCIPIEPTMANISAAAFSHGTGAGSVLGSLLSATGGGAADLVITGSGAVITLKNAGLVEHGYVWDATQLRNGPCTWETTVGFTAGEAAARASVATS
jgi:hypothetical protein